MKKLLSFIYYKFTPLFLKKILCIATSNFRHKELLALHDRPWYAYGLLKSAELAKKKDILDLQLLNLGWQAEEV